MPCEIRQKMAPFQAVHDRPFDFAQMQPDAHILELEV